MTEVITPVFTLESAIALAKEAHEGQVDKDGQPYYPHPLFVMDHLEGETERMTGILHDVPEDTHYTIEDLIRKGCPPDVIAALRLVTRPEDMEDTPEAYLKWIESIRDSENQTAIDVKWVDLTHNSDQTRIKIPTERDHKRWGKYSQAKEILRPVVSPYLLDLTTQL